MEKIVNYDRYLLYFFRIPTMVSYKYLEENNIFLSRNRSECLLYLEYFITILDGFDLEGRGEIEKAVKLIEGGETTETVLLVCTGLMYTWEIEVDKIKYLDNLHNEDNIIVIDDVW